MKKFFKVIENNLILGKQTIEASGVHEVQSSGVIWLTFISFLTCNSTIFYLCVTFRFDTVKTLGFRLKASKLFIYYGGCSAIGRVLAGILCSHRRINAFFIFQAAEFVAGLSTILVTLTSSYSWLVVYIVIYGLSDGFFFTSLSINLLTACPLKTPAVLGWEMLLASLTLASGPPLAGMCNVSCRLY